MTGFDAFDILSNLENTRQLHTFPTPWSDVLLRRSWNEVVSSRSSCQEALGKNVGHVDNTDIYARIGNREGHVMTD